MIVIINCLFFFLLLLNNLNIVINKKQNEIFIFTSNFNIPNIPVDLHFGARFHALSCSLFCPVSQPQETTWRLLIGCYGIRYCFLRSHQSEETCGRIFRDECLFLLERSVSAGGQRWCFLEGAKRYFQMAQLVESSQRQGWRFFKGASERKLGGVSERKPGGACW